MTEQSRREMVLEAALAMIANRGVAGLSTREIAKRSGVSEALIFHHFGTKAGLLEAAAASGETFFAAVMDLAETPPKPDLGASVAALAHEAVRRLRPGTAGWATILSLFSREAAVAALRSDGLAMLKRARGALATWMDASVHPPRGGGEAAAATLFEGILWLVATLPDDVEEWNATAPNAFAELGARWRALHLEN